MYKVCPLCGRGLPKYPALSRVLTGVDICSSCGLREAFCQQTEKGFTDLWLTARRMPDGAIDEIKKVFAERQGK
jgi:hypothetical protein